MRRFVIVNFDKYNPPAKAVNAEVRAGGPLKWIRFETDWYEDGDVMSLPEEERYLWPFLLARGGKGKPRGTVVEDVENLAHLARTSPERVRHTLGHLRRRHRIQYEKGAPPNETTDE